MPQTTVRPLLTVEDFRTEASYKLKKLARDYYESGADDQVTLHRNESAFGKFLIRPRCLRDVSKVDPSVEWFGKRHSFPIGIAPTAFHRMATRDGELSTVKGASLAGSVMISSSWSTTPIEEVTKQAREKEVDIWFQLYVYKDKTVTSGLVSRAEACGCKALVLTVDAPVLGRRLRDIRNGFTLPDGLRTTKLPVIIKGVMRGDDAEEAVHHGVHGIIVSNHGGRQLDSAPATIEVLEEVVKAVQGRVPVFIDGGFRNGRDVFKAIALGANGVFVGRPILWGLSVKGAEGVGKVLRMLQTEFAHTMQLAGCRSIQEIQECPDIVVHERYYAKL